jgi:hypothetical protein
MKLETNVRRVKRGPSSEFLYFRVCAHYIDEQGRVVKIARTPCEISETVSVSVDDAENVGVRLAHARAKVIERVGRMKSALQAIDAMGLEDDET